MYFPFLLLQVLSCDDFFSESSFIPGTYPPTITSNCLLKLVKSSNWSNLSYILENPSKEADTTEALDLLTHYKKTLTQILSFLEIPSSIQTSSASFRWAQSLSEVFIEVRFSHRIDTAGCVEIHDLDYKVQEKHLKVTGKCLLSGHKIIFVLDFDLFKEVISQEAQVEKGVQGRLSFKLKKKKSPDVWNAVYSGVKPSGMSLWHDMQENYQKSIEKFKRKNDL